MDEDPVGSEYLSRGELRVEEPGGVVSIRNRNFSPPVITRSGRPSPLTSIGMVVRAHWEPVSAERRSSGVGDRGASCRRRRRCGRSCRQRLRWVGRHVQVAYGIPRVGRRAVVDASPSRRWGSATPTAPSSWSPSCLSEARPTCRGSAAGCSPARARRTSTSPSAAVFAPGDGAPFRSDTGARCRSRGRPLHPSGLIVAAERP